jgi:hypothetical protein
MEADRWTGQPGSCLFLREGPGTWWGISREAYQLGQGRPTS